jgi:hypothetical protein
LLSGQATVPNPQHLLVSGVSGSPTSLVSQTAVGTRAALAATSSNSDQITLSVKRVPNALQVTGPTAYSTIPYAAAPFQVSNIPDQVIGPTNIDYWTINLDPSDSVVITANESEQTPDPNVKIYVWKVSPIITSADGVPTSDTTYTLLQPTSTADLINPDEVRLTSSVSGQVTVEAPLSGPASQQTPATGGLSLLIGFAQSPQPQSQPPVPDPNQHQSVSPGVTQTFSASFQTFPGSQTNILNILDQYQNPAYQYQTPISELDQTNNWPTFTRGQAAAYNVFETLAQQGCLAYDLSGGQALGTTNLANFTDFRSVGTEYLPVTQSNYLYAVWSPISQIIQDVSNGEKPSIVSDPPVGTIPAVTIDGVYTVYGYTLSRFQTAISNIELPGSSSIAATTTEFRSVHHLLNSANVDRTNLWNFVNDYKSWINQYSAFFAGLELGVGVATNLAKGITGYSTGTEPPLQSSVNELSSITSWLQIAGDLISEIPVIPSVSGLLKLVGNLTGQLAKNQQAQDRAEAEQQGYMEVNTTTVTSQNIMEAGRELDDTTQSQLQYSYIAVQMIEPAIFSNYGVLQAFSSTQFPIVSPQYVNATSAAMQDSYQTMVYQELLPKYFKWQNVTDQPGITTMGTDLNNLIPVQASYEIFKSPPGSKNSFNKVLNSATYTYDQGLWYGISTPSIGSQAVDIESPLVDIETAIQDTLQDFQGGVNIDPQGSGPPYLDNEAAQGSWLTPVPFAGSTAPITPNTLDPYTDDSTLLGRFYAAVPVEGTVDIEALKHNWMSALNRIQFTGYYIMEWRLVNYSTGQEISPVATNQLFGTPDYADATLTYANNAGYLKYDIPQGGLALESDVFNSWGVPDGGNAAAHYSGPPGGNGNGDNLNMNPFHPALDLYTYSIQTSNVSLGLPVEPLPQGTAITSPVTAPVTGSTTYAPGTYFTSPSGRYYLEFQTDGNLVLYDRDLANQAIWASNTADEGVTQLALQQDGNLVLSSSGPPQLALQHGKLVITFSRTPVWASGTDGNPGDKLYVLDDGNVAIFNSTGTQNLWNLDRYQIYLPSNLYKGYTLQPGQELTVDQYLLSPSGQYALIMQSDGNVVLYDLWSRGINPLWTSKTYNLGAAYAIMKSDGNFVAYAGGTAEFATNTSGNHGAVITLLNDGNLVVTSEGGETLWTS